MEKISGSGKYWQSALICGDSNAAFNKLLEHTGSSYKDVAEKAGIKERQAYRFKNSPGGMSFDAYEKICSAFPEFDGIAHDVARYGVGSRRQSVALRKKRDSLNKQSRRLKLMLRCLEISCSDISESTSIDCQEIERYVKGEEELGRDAAVKICEAVNDFSGKYPVFPIDWICVQES